jgi:ribonuclease E
LPSRRCSRGSDDRRKLGPRRSRKSVRFRHRFPSKTKRKRNIFPKRKRPRSKRLGAIAKTRASRSASPRRPPPWRAVRRREGEPADVSETAKICPRTRSRPEKRSLGRRRGRPRTRPQAQKPRSLAAAVADEAVAVARNRRRCRAEIAPDEPPMADLPIAEEQCPAEVEAEAEEKPKERRRPRARKKLEDAVAPETVEIAAQEAVEPAAPEPVPVAEDKPKPRPAPRRSPKMLRR